MLTSSELNKIQGLLHYLNENIGGDIGVEDITVIDTNGEPVARIGTHVDSGGDYVLKKIY